MGQSIHRRRFIHGLIVASLGLGQVWAADPVRPFEIDFVGAAVPGMSAPCNVSLSGGNATINVYSVPAGISYSGTVTSANSTVNVNISPNMPSGTATVYLQVAGSQVQVATTVSVTNN